QVSRGSRWLVARNMPALVCVALASGHAPSLSVSASETATASGGIGAGARSRSTTYGAAPAGEHTGVMTERIAVWNVSVPPQVKPWGQIPDRSPNGLHSSYTTLTGWPSAGGGGS